MPARLLRCYAAGALLVLPALVPAGALAAPTDADRAETLRVEAMQDRWQGRRSLYEDDHSPGAETVGQRPDDGRACINEPVRLRRSDGSTVVRRFRRCE